MTGTGNYSVVLKALHAPPEVFRIQLLNLGMKPVMADRVLQSIPCVLKQHLELDAARRYEEAFTRAGGLIAVEPEAKPEEIELDVAPPPPAPVAPRLPPRLLQLPQPTATSGLTAATVATDAAGDRRTRLIVRGAVAAIALTVLFGGCSLWSRYQVFDKHHAFSRLCADELKARLNKVWHSEGTATRADLDLVLADFARRADVKVTEIEIIARPIYQAPGAAFAGPNHCPPRYFEGLEELPKESILQFQLMMTSCEAASWAIGVKAKISAGYGLYSSSREVEHWAFVMGWEDDAEY